MTPGELRTLADGYQLKAERYWDDYQRDGTTAQKRAYDRNQGLAEALYDASDARNLREQLARLRELVLILDVGDTRGLLRMQERIREGEL